jgi:N-acyl-D-amino-acid deacylase
LPPERVSLLLKGGTVHDGTGAGPLQADIGINGSTIASIGKAALEGDRVIDISGLCVSPGFIDTHGHSDFTLFQNNSHEGKILQGITTEINGNCGLSAAPLIGEALAQRQKDLEGIDERWPHLKEYLGLIEDRGLMTNFATLAGHGSIRASAMGYGDRSPGEDDMREMKRLLRESLEAGAIGLSTGLIYPPGIYARTGELVELAREGKAASPGGFIYATHMRSEGKRLVESVEEALVIAREAGVRVHISHIKTAGKDNWQKIDRVIALMEEARGEGLSITCDRYPYTAGSTDLDSVLSAWVFEGGAAEELRRLKDPETRERIKGELLRERPDRESWSRVCISTVSREDGKWMEGRSVKEVAERMGMDPVDALLKILVEEELRVDAVMHSMSEENLRRFLSLPFTMIGSDSAARPLMARGKPHPRGFGTFPRFIGRYAEDLGRAIHKITMLPAETFGLRGRGLLREGFFADITVFDPARIKDRATFEEPFQAPEGIYYVIVNGVPVLSEGKLTGMRPGMVLRGGG